jgi:hypothetical protein
LGAFGKRPDAYIPDQIVSRANRDMERPRVERVIIGIHPVVSPELRPPAARVKDSAAEFGKLRHNG